MLGYAEEMLNGLVRELEGQNKRRRESIAENLRENEWMEAQIAENNEMIADLLRAIEGTRA